MGFPSFLPFRDESTPRKTYKGACHCGKFQFECDHPILEDGFEALTCNCSICAAKGAIYIYITNPEKEFRITKGVLTDLGDYRFGPKTVAHLFCKCCGSNVLEDFSLNGARVVAANVRFITGLDLDKTKLRYLDGKAMDSVIVEALKEMNA